MMSGRWLGRVEVGATGVALTALAGEWLVHTLEYARVWSPHRAFSSVHAYMGPTGFLLVVAALVGVHSTARLARRLESRLAELHRIHAGRWKRGSTNGSLATGGPCSLSVSALVAILWTTQCGLYLLQENLEAGFAHHGAPGLSVLGGAHALAPLVHLAVAVALVAGLWLARHRVTKLVHAVRLAEARLRFVRRPEATTRPFTLARAWTPIDRWGMQLWSRPPPAPGVV